jgi:hypothetical protein
MLLVALDADIPKKAVTALKVIFGGDELDFLWVPDIVPANTEDIFWAPVFRKKGGRVIISGDKEIAKRPHQIIAFQQNELICFFMEPPWSSNYRLNAKAASLIYWWPAIATQIEKSSLGDVWQVPLGWKIGEMKSLRIPEEALKEVEAQTPAAASE